MTQRRTGVTTRPRGRAASAVVAAALAAWITVPQTGAVAAAAEVSAAPGVSSMQTAEDARIVFARLIGDPENYEIWTMDRAGGHQRQLTSNAVADHDPAWSPDGARIAWARFEDQFNVGVSDIWLMNADGTDRHRLTRLHAGIGSPTWSPDGTRIAFERDYRIWVINADGTALHPISPSGAFDFSPDWSPDGQWIVFSSNGPRSFDLFAMHSDGSERHLLAATEGTNEYDAAWSPNGRRIAYSANKRNDPVGWHVSLMRADGTGRHIVIDDYSLDPAWAPGGTRLAFHACTVVACGLHTSTFRGDGVTPLGYRGYSDIQPDYRPMPVSR